MSTSAPVDSSSASGLTLVPYLRATALHKTVTVELVSGYRLTGRLAACDPATMNISLDYLRGSEVLVKGSNLASSSNSNGQVEEADNAHSTVSDKWVPNPREFKFLKSIFIRGSAIKFLDISSDEASALLSTYPMA
eukprot:GILI01028673.1.p1 GENE.GILI01028673.1~~GILI01028673.1.p1  ORF type:complete len:154 (+),score=8.44 GILI01028673.1:57-464(+)